MIEPNPQLGMLLDVAGFSDAELLALFLQHHDEAAFSEVVQRYRGLVWSVCRRVLSDSHDIEDVFQATFLVLVRDASRIRKQQSLANWLYGVAYRLSLRVARQTVRRREVALPANRQLADASLANNDLNNLAELFVRQTVDDELHALPARYRQPLVLHYLVGKSQKDVAAELNLTVGAVDGLLKRGRHELRLRLARRGVSIGAVWLVLQWTSQSVQAAPLVALTQSTVQAGLAAIAGKTTGGLSTTVCELTRKELSTMSLTTKAATTVAAAICAIGIVGGGANWLFGSNPIGGDVELPISSSVSSDALSDSPVPNQATAILNNAALAMVDDSVRQPPQSAPTSASSASSKNGSAATWDLRTISQTEQRISAGLAEPTEINFTDSPLTDVVQFLSDFHNIPMILDLGSLNEDGIATDTPITRTLTGGSLESALNIVLLPMGLDFVIADDVLKVTTIKTAAETLDARVYDLSRIPNLDTKTLSSIIMAATKPNAWVEKNGQGSIVAGPDFLVVNQNQRAHRQIVTLLNQLERLPGQQLKRVPAKAM